MRKRITFAILIILLMGPSILLGCSKKQVSLYFAKEIENNFYLVEEKRQINSENIYLNSIEALVKGPSNKKLLPVLPEETEVNSVTIEGELAIVDFGKDIITDQSIPHSSTTESLAIYSIVNTLTGFDKIKKVKITVNGKSSGKVDGYSIEDFWGHIGISKEFKRNEEIIYGNKWKAKE